MLIGSNKALLEGLQIHQDNVLNARRDYNTW